MQPMALTTDLMDSLQVESSFEATHKSDCDEEMAKANEKKVDLEAEVAKHFSKLESAVGTPTLGGEVMELQADFGALSAQHWKMDVMRADERKILELPFV